MFLALCLFASTTQAQLFVASEPQTQTIIVQEERPLFRILDTVESIVIAQSNRPVVIHQPRVVVRQQPTVVVRQPTRVVVRSQPTVIVQPRSTVIVRPNRIIIR
jgi:hypothetical protein